MQTDQRGRAYAVIALLLLEVAGIGIVARLAHFITLFWLELAVAALFVTFRTVQTLEIDA